MAIASLRNRFGRDELLVEVYVRELLMLVLQNALKPTEKISFSSLYDKLESHLRALETLGVTTDKCAAMLFPLVESSLPKEVLRAWQRKITACGNNDGKDRLTLLMNFVQSEVENEERIKMAVTGFSLVTDDEGQKRTRNKTETTRSTPTAMGLWTKSNKCTPCVFCEAEHDSADCEAARKLTLPERRDIAKRKKCCFNCLKGGHSYKQCKMATKCAWCSKKHVVLMCREMTKDKAQGDAMKDVASTSVEPATHTLVAMSVNAFTYMMTLRVHLSANGRTRVVRVFIDTGAERSYILKHVAAQMGFTPVGEESIQHSLFGGSRSAVQNHHVYRIHLQSMSENYACNFEVMDQDTICEQVSCIGRSEWTRELEAAEITLSDTGPSDEPISVLIGADVAGKLFTGRKYELKNGLTAMETFLGWTIMGKVPDRNDRSDAVLTVMSMYVRDAEVTSLWKLDVLGIDDPVQRLLRQERDQRAVDNFVRSVTRGEDGRYEVSLTWVEDHAPLPNNKMLARRRLDNTTRKLRAEGLFEDYNRVLPEWLSEGIVEKVPDSEAENYGHYLPHRHVVKSNSTTKLRPVFDVSAREKNFPSLNQCLETGPNMIDMIPSVLMQFRRNRIGVTADIKKAFLQIGMNSGDCDFLRFLWWKNDSDTEPQIYRHARVVFGVSCSPFLLEAVIRLHLNAALEESQCERLKKTLQKLRRSFYVDNVVSSVDNNNELEYFIEHSRSVMATACFDLRGWEYSGDGCSTESAVLGLIWDKQQDVLRVNTATLSRVELDRVTKRTILATAQRLFDPIGFTCPVTLFPKLLLQRTWKDDIGWDSEVNAEMKQEFLSWSREVEPLMDVRIPRSLNYEGPEGVSLHTFCDASQLAYATAVFLRTETSEGVKINLIGAKSRVAPIKKMTIPRLELLAATVGARLTNFLVGTMDIPGIPITLWTDSMTTLAWIQREAEWTTFVWNQTGPGNWRYVPGTMNPADLPSRGCAVKTLLSTRWWEGPGWLQLPESTWPIPALVPNDAEVQAERKKSVIIAALSTGRTVLRGDRKKDPLGEQSWHSRYFSKFNQIVRLVGWVMRFIHNCRVYLGSRRSGELNLEEVRAAEMKLWRAVQQESFDGDQDARLNTLYAYTDKTGIIRVKTKVFNRADSASFRCPIVLDLGM